MINPQLASVFFFLLFALSPICGYQFEYFQLVLQWPETFCHTKPCAKRKIPRNFTIHGLWPDKQGPIMPLNCPISEKIKDIREPHKTKILEHYWPDLKSTVGNSNGFWKYEFTKHGTCSKELYNQDAYFDLAMNLKDRFDLLKILKNKGITPGYSYTYTVKDVEDAIRTVTTELPNLNCVGDPLKTMELLEIGICFNREATKVIKCDRSWPNHPSKYQKITIPP